MPFNAETLVTSFKGFDYNIVKGTNKSSNARVIDKESFIFRCRDYGTK